jgi:hypothetical protein
MALIKNSFHSGNFVSLERRFVTRRSPSRTKDDSSARLRGTHRDSGLSSVQIIPKRK